MGTSPAGSVLLPTRLPSNGNLMLLVPIAVVVTWGGGFLRLLGSQDKAGWTSETSHNRLAGFTMGLALSWPRHVVSSVESGGGLGGGGSVRTSMTRPGWVAASLLPSTNASSSAGSSGWSPGLSLSLRAWGLAVL